MPRFPRHPASAGARPCPGRSSPGPGGPAGPPPGQGLRSSSYIAANAAGQASKISSTKVSTLSGEPRVTISQGHAAEDAPQMNQSGGTAQDASTVRNVLHAGG